MKKRIFQIIASALSLAFLLVGTACEDEQIESTGGTVQETLTAVEGEYLYKSGISEYSILIRDDASYYESFAANELVMNLQEATGNSIPVITESQLKSKDRIISLGHTSLWDEKVGVTLSEKDIIDSGYYIKTVENNVYISCPDENSSSGILYGAYDFLKDAIDYEFYAADEVYVEKTQEIPLYNYTGKIVNPTFEMRMIPKADLRDNSTTVMRYRLMSPSDSFGLVAWGHGQLSQYILPKAKCTCGLEDCGDQTYMEHHPDWFLNPEDKYQWQLCWSGGELLEEVTANRFIEFFNQYPDAEYFMFGLEDNVNKCECDRCKAAMQEYAGNPAGLQIAFMNNVIARVKAKEPNRSVKYIIYAYYATEKAPIKTENGKIVPYSEKVDPVDDLYIYYTPIGANFAFQINSPTNIDVYNNLKEWSAIADGQLILYLYDINFRNYLINFNNFGTVQGMYETCRDVGVNCITSQGADSYTICFQEMRSYVESSLMWNVDQSYDDLVRKFMAAYFKDAADFMYTYYQIMRDRYAYYQNMVAPESGGIYGDINSTKLWTQPVMEKIDKEFDKAFASIEKYKTSDPDLYTKLYNRIMKECLSPLYMKITMLSAYYTTAEMAQIKADFKYYANFFKLSESLEGADFGNLLN